MDVIFSDVTVDVLQNFDQPFEWWAESIPPADVSWREIAPCHREFVIHPVASVKRVKDCVVPQRRTIERLLKGLIVIAFHLLPVLSLIRRVATRRIAALAV